MTRSAAGTLDWLRAMALGSLLTCGAGCLGVTSSQSLSSGTTTAAGHVSMPPAGIYHLLAPPSPAPPPEAPAELPAPPARLGPPQSAPPDNAPSGKAPSDKAPPAKSAPETTQPAPVATARTPLELDEVLQSVERHFPLLLAAEQERAIAAGQRLAAEGAFDLTLRTRGATQGGTFPNNRFDAVLEQPTPVYGVNFFSGYRFGFGDFPVYYGDRATADGGEFRAGVLIPLLRDGAIDRRRASLRQAQLGELLADPVVQRARIDSFRAAARAYWNWVAAGEQHQVADALLRLARDRQAGLEEQFTKGQIAEFVVIDNRRLIVEREGALIAAERRWQQTSFDLSLFLRDGAGNPATPGMVRLPRPLTSRTPAPPSAELLRGDVETAYRLRPEMVRFQLLRERTAVELQLAENQAQPALNAAVAGAQDVGKGKQSSGIFELDRSLVEASLLLEVPLQRREARGRAQAAQATLMQILAQERFARDQIMTEVQDAVSNLDRTYQRLDRAREEQRIAQRVADLELERFRKGQSTLLEVNLRELAAASAQAKVIDALADYFRAQADHRAALGLDARPDGPR